MQIGLAQINSRVGDLRGNLERILAAYCLASEKGADLVIFPEMITCGYPPLDLLYDPNFVAGVVEVGEEIARATKTGPPIIFGTVATADRTRPGSAGLWNQAVVASGGEVIARRAKQILPDYDVFHESRWFVPGWPAPPVEVAGRKIGLLICEDLWDEGYAIHPRAELERAGSDLLVCISASPFRQGIAARRLRLAEQTQIPLVYLNAVGAQDELVFDGGSFVRASDRVHHLPAFKERVEIVTLGSEKNPSPSGWERSTFQALKLGISDFLAKNRLPRAVVGLSGGIDSALVACLARSALGPEKVLGVTIPSRHSDSRSEDTARELADNLGIGFECVPMETMHRAAEESLPGLLEGLAAENVQARIRMTVLMAFVNRLGGLLLNTSNKTELALGYGTLYGDLAGTLSPLGDLTKVEVYSLASWLNDLYGWIPEFTLKRAPSAELKTDQVDPFDYPRLAPEVEAEIQGQRARRGLLRYEYKRRNGPLILKVSEKAFGSGRLMPVTCALTDAKLSRRDAPD